MSVIDYANYFHKTWGAQIVPLWGIRPGEGGGSVCRCKDGAECGRPGKHSIKKWKDAPSRLPGRYDNYGIVSDTLVVIDFDKPDAEFPYALPDTYTVRTAKGRHLYYKHLSPLATRISFVPGIDVKASGGLVVGPGSVTIKGGTYEPANELPIVDLPADIAEAVGVRREMQVRQGTLPLVTHFMAAKAVAIVCDEQRQVRDSRNNELFRNTARALRFGAGRDSLDLIAAAAMESGLGHEEVWRTINSAVLSVYGA